MMTTLKNADRDEVVRRVLTDAFAPRFTAIQKLLQGLLRTKLQEEHPEFVKLAGNPEARKYLATTTARNIYFMAGEDCIIAAAPTYGARAKMPEPPGYYRIERDQHTLLKDCDTLVPCILGDLKVSDATVIDAYRKAWADYVAACDKLLALLYSYNVREKFEVDFPEFAKYLPPTVVKPKLPVVVAKEVRAELSAFGVPA